MKGKAVIILHVYNDFLWAMGDKSGPPELKDISDDEYIEDSDDDEPQEDASPATTAAVDSLEPPNLDEPAPAPPTEVTHSMNYTMSGTIWLIFIILLSINVNFYRNWWSLETISIPRAFIQTDSRESHICASDLCVLPLYSLHLTQPTKTRRIGSRYQEIKLEKGAKVSKSDREDWAAETQGTARGNNGDVRQLVSSKVSTENI